MMGRVSSSIIGSIIGGSAATVAIVLWFGWGTSSKGQAAHVDPSRSDYIDLLLTIITILLGAIGLALTVGALVVGLVALKTLREIKEEASTGAKSAAAEKIKETMETELQPNVNLRVQEVLPEALQSALLQDELAHNILRRMAQRGELDEVLERVAMRVQVGGPETDIDAK